METNENQSFSYTYSAKEQNEIKSIRAKYITKETDKMEQLRILDRKVTGKAAGKSITLGVIGSLVLGTGMSCAMVWQGKAFVPGIIIGVIGIGLVASAYPLYKRILKHEREKTAPQILKLTDELLK